MKRTPKSTAITTRYPDDVLDVLRILAKEHERSLHGEIIWALRDYAAKLAPHLKRPVQREDITDD